MNEPHKLDIPLDRLAWFCTLSDEELSRFRHKLAIKGVERTPEQIKALQKAATLYLNNYNKE